MEQGKNILEKISEIKEEIGNLETDNTAILNKIEKIQKHLELMQNMLPKKIHQFTAKDFEGYINIISQIKEEILELNKLDNDIENVSFKIKTDFILKEIEDCKTKAEKRLEEKKKNK